jgi:GH24 family phage-related lysozyme (muramidase)
MKIGNSGLSLIKTFEGCRLTAYKAVSTEEYYTIGWGHYGSDVYNGETITQSMADIMLITDLIKYENYVNNKAYVPVELNQNQFDALVSFCYNCGAGSLKQLCKNRTTSQISTSIYYYNKSSAGVTLQGLINRRVAEIKLFNTEVSEMTETEIRSIIQDEITKTLKGSASPDSITDKELLNAISSKITDGSRYDGYATRGECMKMSVRAAEYEKEV